MASTALKIVELSPNEIRNQESLSYLKNNLRITLDTDLKYKNFFRDKYIKINENFEKKKFLIVEFKFADECYEFVKLLSSQISNRFTKFSKYEFSLTN